MGHTSSNAHAEGAFATVADCKAAALQMDADVRKEGLMQTDGPAAILLGYTPRQRHARLFKLRPGRTSRPIRLAS